MRLRLQDRACLIALQVHCAVSRGNKAKIANRMDSVEWRVVLQVAELFWSNNKKLTYFVTYDVN